MEDWRVGIFSKIKPLIEKNGNGICLLLNLYIQQKAPTVPVPPKSLSIIVDETAQRSYLLFSDRTKM